MKSFKTTILPVLLATTCISIFEFVRNQFWLMPLWVNHYKELGLVFPAQPVNGAVWGIWAALFAVFIFILSKKFSLLETSLLSWLVGFVLMWLVIGNMGVLPFKILPYSVPMSLIEVLLASWITKKFSRN